MLNFVCLAQKLWGDFVFYDRFVSLCKRKGVKPTRVAVDTGFNKGSVSSWKKNWEKGIDVRPTPDILSKIAKYFNVSTDYLLGEDDGRTAPVFDEDIMFALFEGDKDVTPEMFEEVKQFAKFVKERKKHEQS